MTWGANSRKCTPPRFKMHPGVRILPFQSLFPNISESHLGFGDIFVCTRDGTRKAVQKTYRRRVFRPWESPSDSKRIRYGCGWNLNMSDGEKSLVRVHCLKSPIRTLAPNNPDGPRTIKSKCPVDCCLPSAGQRLITISQRNIGKESHHDRPEIENLPVLTVAIRKELKYNPFSTNNGGNYP